jgi:hypothetical protein
MTRLPIQRRAEPAQEAQIGNPVPPNRDPLDPERLDRDHPSTTQAAHAVMSADEKIAASSPRHQATVPFQVSFATATPAPGTIPGQDQATAPASRAAAAPCPVPGPGVGVASGGETAGPAPLARSAQAVAGFAQLPTD